MAVFSERFRELRAILDSKCSGIYSTTADNAVLGNAGSRKSQFFARFFLNHPEKYILLLKKNLGKVCIKKGIIDIFGWRQ